MLKRFHVIRPKMINFAQRNGILRKILPKLSFLTELFFKIIISLHREISRRVRIGTRMCAEIIKKKNKYYENNWNGQRVADERGDERHAGWIFRDE
jgi:hypothetical protein